MIKKYFKSFDEKSFASASIGQVYRAVLHDGQNVVVKVQYPGVDESCDSDLKQLRIALKLAGVLKIDKKLQDALFHEIQESLQKIYDKTCELDVEMIPEESLKKMLKSNEDKLSMLDMTVLYEFVEKGE